MSSLHAGWIPVSFTTETSVFGAGGEYTSSTVIVILVGYVVLLGTSGYFTHYVLRQAGMDIESTERETLDVDRDTGTVIGKIENVLILTLMLLEAYTALGVIFAAKSLVRKSDMDTGDTSYYLTGTLANFTYSVVIGVVLQVVLVRMSTLAVFGTVGLWELVW